MHVPPLSDRDGHGLSPPASRPRYGRHPSSPTTQCVLTRCGMTRVGGRRTVRVPRRDASGLTTASAARCRRTASPGQRRASRSVSTSRRRPALSVRGRALRQRRHTPGPQRSPDGSSWLDFRGRTRHYARLPRSPSELAEIDGVTDHGQIHAPDRGRGAAADHQYRHRHDHPQAVPQDHQAHRPRHRRCSPRCATTRTARRTPISCSTSRPTGRPRSSSPATISAAARRASMRPGRCSISACAA